MIFCLCCVASGIADGGAAFLDADDHDPVEVRSFLLESE